MIKICVIGLTGLLSLVQYSFAQSKPAYTPAIEPCDCQVKLTAPFKPNVAI